MMSALTTVYCEKCGMRLELIFLVMAARYGLRSV